VAVQRDIYCNFTDGRFVQSNKSAQAVSFQSAFHQDNLRLVIHPLEVEPSNAPSAGPFTELDPTGWSVVVKIFKASDGTELAAQNTWTVDGNTLVGSINLNTVAMSTAVGSSSSLSCIVEFEFQDASGNKLTVGGYQHGIFTVYKELITSGTPANLASETYLTETASRSQFVPKVGAAGEGFYLTSPDGTKTGFIYWGDDGSLKSEPVN
jgi:hypothetical protein